MTNIPLRPGPGNPDFGKPNYVDPFSDEAPPQLTGCPNCGEPLADDEVTVVDSLGSRVHLTCAMGGRKDTAKEGKALERYDLIPPEMERLLANLYGFGAQKYDARNWEKGIAWSALYNSLRRHLSEFWSGNELDDGPGGSGLPHLVAVIWNATALLEFTTTHPELDDRPGKPAPEKPTLADRLKAVSCDVHGLANCNCNES